MHKQVDLLPIRVKYSGADSGEGAPPSSTKKDTKEKKKKEREGRK